MAAATPRDGRAEGSNPIHGHVQLGEDADRRQKSITSPNGPPITALV